MKYRTILAVAALSVLSTAAARADDINAAPRWWVKMQDYIDGVPLAAYRQDKDNKNLIDPTPHISRFDPMIEFARDGYDLGKFRTNYLEPLLRPSETSYFYFPSAGDDTTKAEQNLVTLYAADHLAFDNAASVWHIYPRSVTFKIKNSVNGVAPAKDTDPPLKEDPYHDPTPRLSIGWGYCDGESIDDKHPMQNVTFYPSFLAAPAIDDLSFCSGNVVVSGSAIAQDHIQDGTDRLLLRNALLKAVGMIQCAKETEPMKDAQCLGMTP